MAARQCHRGGTHHVEVIPEDRLSSCQYTHRETPVISKTSKAMALTKR